jgi:hypothetical protein
MLGLIECPNCAEEIRCSAILCMFCHHGISFRHFKKCRFCGELVRLKALKCRFCQSDLDPPEYTRVPLSPYPPVQSGEIALQLQTELPNQQEGLYE